MDKGVKEGTNDGINEWRNDKKSEWIPLVYHLVPPSKLRSPQLINRDTSKRREEKRREEKRRERKNTIKLGTLLKESKSTYEPHPFSSSSFKIELTKKETLFLDGYSNGSERKTRVKEIGKHTAAGRSIQRNVWIHHRSHLDQVEKEWDG